MATTNLATNLATTTKVKKPETNLPYVQPNQNLPLSNNVANGAAGMQPVASAGQMAAGMVPQVSPQTQQFNQTLNTAQNMATQGAQAPNPTLDMTSQKTQELLQNPNQGFDAAKQKQQTLESYDRERANALKAMQGEAADTSFLGTTIDKLTNQYLQGAENRVMLERDTDLQNQQQERQNLLAALAEGRNTSTAEQNRFAANIGALTNVIGAGEGQQNREFTGQQAGMDRTQQLLLQSNDLAGQKDIANLQNIAESGRLATQQDFQKAQSALDRAQQLAIQSNDVNAQKEIEAIKQKFQSQMQSTELQFQEKLKTMDIESQTSLTQLKAALDKDQLLTSQDFQKAQSALDRELSKALAEGDTNKAIQLLQMQQDFQSQMQSNEMQFQEKLKTMDIDSQTALTTLKAALDKDQLLTSQDFQAAQSSLDRELSKALAEGDTAKAIQLLEMQQDFQGQMQEKQNQYSTAERIATQSWQTSENISQQDFQRATQYIDQQNALAMQSNDINAQERLQTMRSYLELTMQTQDMNQQEKMAYLGAQLQEAAAVGDFGRQQELMTYSNKLEINKMIQEQGFEAGQSELNRKLQLAMQSNDFTQATSLQKMSMEFQATEAAKDRVLEQSKIALQEKGLNADIMQKEFERLTLAEENGTIAAGSALAYLQKTMADSGVTIEAPDPNAVNAAIDAEYDSMMYQFLKTNPQYKNTDKNSTSVLNPDGMKAFNDYFNKTMYGTEGGTESKVQQLVTGTMSDSNLRGKTMDDPAYAQLFTQAADFNNTGKYETKGNNQQNFTGSVPSNGEYFKYNGKLYKATSNKAVNYKTGLSREYEYFTAIDVSTGQTITIKPTGVDGRDRTNNNYQADRSRRERID